MLVEEFEEIAAFAEREIETVGLEFVEGRIGARKATNGNHGTVVAWPLREWMSVRPGLGLYPGAGLKVGPQRTGRVVPDGALAPIGHFSGQGDWAEPDGVLMTVEVTSHDSDTYHRDRVEKPLAYATANIPAYLLIDRVNTTVTLHSDPHPEIGYRTIRREPFGAKLSLPDPVGIELDTERLKQYVD
ncbi:Uma2 family endonuclease [Streptomyces sp. TRM70350]|uniref:Uma2 family endonuclease n=1 Tax=Streptomyces sp. TRM70350 TaxID=2856165 RepID=UPI001C465F0E|nr:Uma2 family endonuclease [Streptomyces sp. TRM70350]MBV7696141.1 Uma2 family endonuclease [Streptomyces sp. TRM70350]